MVDIKKKYITFGVLAVIGLSFMSFTSAKIGYIKDRILLKGMS
jgi:hypothetical protein